jgi:hypothetical protein
MRSGIGVPTWCRGWLGLALALVAVPAAAAPARLRVTVTRNGVAESRVIERTVPRTFGAAGPASEKVNLSGNGWQMQGVVAGTTDARQPSGPVPRGGITVSFLAKLGMALGFINNGVGTVDVEAEVCLDGIFDSLPSVYGGSIAGSLLDGEGDGTGTVTNDSMGHAIYELRWDSALCADPNGTQASIHTLYNATKTVNVPGVYQGITIAPDSFGTPIPSGAGPTSSNAFEMVVRFSLTRGDFVGFTSVGVVFGEGTIGPGTTLPSAATGGRAGAAPRSLSPSSSGPVVLVPRGFATPAPLVGPVYSIGFAVGEQTQANQDIPPAPTPTPTPVTTPFNEHLSTAVSFRIAPPSRHGGIILGSLTDFSGTTCTVKTKTGIALYRAGVDGTTQFKLYDDPTSFMASGYGSGVIAVQAFGTPIPHAFGPVVTSSLSLDLDFQFVNDCMATFLALYVVPACEPSYDVDKNGSIGALTDGLIILRWLFGFSGSSLTAGALGAGAQRTSPAEISSYLACAAPFMLDVDGNNALGALTDGLLILRSMFGFTGTTLTAGALGAGATRTDPVAVATFMDQFKTVGPTPTPTPTPGP